MSAKMILEVPMSKPLPVSQVTGAAAAAVERARAGETTEITSRGEVVARLVPADGDYILEPIGAFELPTRTYKLHGSKLASDVVSEDRG